MKLQIVYAVWKRMCALNGIVMHKICVCVCFSMGWWAFKWVKYWYITTGAVYAAFFMHIFKIYVSFWLACHFVDGWLVSLPLSHLTHVLLFFHFQNGICFLKNGQYCSSATTRKLFETKPLLLFLSVFAHMCLKSLSLLTRSHFTF